MEASTLCCVFVCAPSQQLERTVGSTCSAEVLQLSLCHWAGWGTFPAKGRLDMYDIIRGPHNITSLKLSLLYSVRLIW